MENLQHEVAAASVKYPTQWKTAHTDGPGTEDFIRLLAADLYAKYGGIHGLNGKRGNPNDISDDALAVFDPAGDVVDASGKRMYIVDVIVGAGGPNPAPGWSSVGGPSPGAWVKPTASTVPPVIPPSGPICPDPSAHQPKPKPAYPGDQTFQNILGVPLEADYKEAKQPMNAGSVVWASRTIWDDLNEGLTLEESVAKHRGEWRAALGLGAK